MKFSIKDLFSNWDQIRKKLILIDSNKHGNANLFLSLKKQPPEVFSEKGVLRNFTKFTGKHLCQSLFFNEVAGLRPAKKL